MIDLRDIEQKHLCERIDRLSKALYRLYYYGLTPIQVGEDPQWRYMAHVDDTPVTVHAEFEAALDDAADLLVSLGLLNQMESWFEHSDHKKAVDMSKDTYDYYRMLDDDVKACVHCGKAVTEDTGAEGLNRIIHAACVLKALEASKQASFDFGGERE